MNTQPSPKTFEFMPGVSLRAIEIDGEPWFVAKDVCSRQPVQSQSRSGHG
ncbi:hypothetical protein ACOTH1_19825 [Achromobacter ruhlandii]